MHCMVGLVLSAGLIHEYTAGDMMHLSLLDGGRLDDYCQHWPARGISQPCLLATHLRPGRACRLLGLLQGGQTVRLDSRGGKACKIQCSV